jgi:ribosome-associated protein
VLESTANGLVQVSRSDRADRIQPLETHFRRSGLEPIELARHIVRQVEEKRGEDVLLLDISELDTFTDYFVFCSGNSDRQLRALLEGVLKSVKDRFRTVPWSKEGSGDTEWVLLDYGDVVVHLFSPEKRAYYDLEELWKEGKVLLHIQ